MEENVELYKTGWSDWSPFPNPQKGEYLYAPFGPGVYQLRNRKTDEFVLFGQGDNVAFRMSSLLPEPYGAGFRKNAKKREYVWKYIDDIEYRTIALEPEKIKAFEEFIKKKKCHIFNT